MSWEKPPKLVLVVNESIGALAHLSLAQVHKSFVNNCSPFVAHSQSPKLIQPSIGTLKACLRDHNREDRVVEQFGRRVNIRLAVELWPKIAVDLFA